MDLIKKYILPIKIGVATPLLSGCYGPGTVDEPYEYLISGTLTVPEGFQGLLRQQGKLSKMLSSVYPERNNALTNHETVVQGATVELIELHDNGFQEYSYLPNEHTTTNSRGQFSLSTTERPSSTLLLSASGDYGVSLRALAVANNTDINIYSEYAYSLIIEQVHSNPEVFLPYFQAAEVENIVSSIEGLNVNLSTASSVNVALDLIRTADAGVIASEVARMSTPNLEGDWFYTKKSGSNSCGFAVGVELISTEINVSQVNDALTIYVDGTVFSTGTLFGREVIGIELETYPENGGTMVQSSSTLTVATDGESVEGSVSWDWFGPDASCSGVDSVSITREPEVVPS